MNFKIEKEVFQKGLSRIQNIVEKRNTIPILSNVLIEAEENQIHLTATDLEVGMRASFPAKTEIKGKITVSAKKLFEIIRELPEKEISFTTKQNSWIEIRCEKALFNIVGLSADEFPNFPLPEKNDYITLKSHLLKEMLEKTSFSVSTDESKYNLNGIFFKSFEEKEKNFLRLVATDGHRLSLIQREMDVSHINELITGVIFPRKGIIELKKISEDGDEDISLGFMDNSAIIKKGKIVIIMRLVDGDFPDYTRVVPKNNEYSCLIDRELFLYALKRISILSSEKSKGVKLLLTSNNLEISSSNPEFGDAREELEISYEGPEISIGFNARYLMDILLFQDADKIKLLVKDNLSPGLLIPSEDEDYLAVVMPMRL